MTHFVHGDTRSRPGEVRCCMERTSQNKSEKHQGGSPRAIFRVWYRSGSVRAFILQSVNAFPLDCAKWGFHNLSPPPFLLSLEL
jgi:hypothetical protein